MGNLFGLPEQKLCPKCKNVLPAAAFHKYKRRRKNGNVSERLNSSCKECANKANVERQKKRYHTEQYKAIAKQSRDKRRKRNAFIWASENEGSHCVVHWHKCTDCGREKQYRNKVNENDLCDRCLMFKDWRENGFECKEKQVKCSKCGTIHNAKKVGAMCDKCRGISRKVSSRESNRRNRKHNRAKYGTTHRARARKYGVYYEPVNRLKVYDRDKWKCCECGCKVVRSVEYKPNQATIDHVIPMSKGGAHTYSNVVTMCMSCNSIKSNNLVDGLQVTLFSKVVDR